MDAADVEAVLAEAIELGSANLTYVWEDSAPEEKALMAGVAAAMRHGTDPVIIDDALDACRDAGIRLPEGEVARALRSLTSREILGGDQAYRFNVDLQRLWCQKHRHLDWGKTNCPGPSSNGINPPRLQPSETVPRVAGPGPDPRPGASDGQKPQGPPAKTRPRTARTRYLAIAAAVMILLLARCCGRASVPVLYSLATPTSSSAPARSLMQDLIRLMPGGLTRDPQKCQSTASSNPWTMRGLLLKLDARSPNYQVPSPPTS